ncbi:hypothetical protein KI688_008074 [Linnemannia hyalina]|uniref:C2H2-type domain-containing protein n=1 Tax=Linnemannia hyalina TaxID=64524 RepID=A0A9P7Y0G0_9FUNG|nr:hypothetical protein KI688_008074 [Linnemannia hyalina]
MFFHDTTSDLNKYPMNYNMFADNAMAMAAAPGCNSDMLPTEFIYPNYNLNHSNGLADLSAGFMAHQQQQQQQPRPRGLHHHHSSTSSTSSSTNSSTSSIVLDNAYLLSSSSSTPVSTSSSLHSYSESSNAPYFLTSDTSSSTSSTPSSSSPISSTSSIAPNPALISTVTGSSSSSPTSASAMDYMLTNQNSLLVQPHQQHQQQHYRQHQQIDHRPTARVQGSYPHHHHHHNNSNNNNNNNNMQQQYVPFPANDFQGVPSSAAPASSSSAVITPAVIVCSQQGPGTGPQQQQYSPWNIDMATSSNPTANAQLQLTSAPFISNPAKSTPTPSSAATATISSVAWTNESEDGGGGQTTHRSKQQQQQQQQLHIMTSLDSGVASMYPHISGSHNHHGLALSVAASLVSQHQQQPSCITSPAQQAAMSAHFQNQPQYQHHASWGMAATTSSPVESCFNSGSSTPSFASSMSPTLSYSSFELGSSDDSSRATSPSRHNQHHHHHYHHGTPYDAPSHFERRHRRRDSDASSSLIIRSRKSSTSSTSSTASQRRMSTLRESTLPSTPVSSSNNNTTTTATTTSVSSPTHQCPTCNLCFAGPAVLVRHIESIHDKLLWNCVGCKSNLSRRDAVTRHINLSPMDSVCRAVGTIGQIKMLNGSEVHYEISSYKAKPLDEVMNRMGKKISATLRQEIDRAKAMTEANNAIAAASVASVAAEPVVSTVVAMGAHHHQYQQQHEYGFTEDIMARLREAAVADGMTATAASDEELMMVGGEYDDEMEYESDGSVKKRRQPFQHTLGQREK